MSEKAMEFDLHVEQVDAYEFRVRFDKPQYPEVRFDEPAPLGKDAFPNAARMLAATIGNCLSASLVFCMQRKNVKIEGMRTEVHVEVVRNERKRLRIGGVKVTLRPDVEASEELTACLDTFEDFCIVTQSVRGGIDVQVNVEPMGGV